MNILALIFSLFVSVAAVLQDEARVEELEAKLAQPPTDEERAATLAELSKTFWTNNPKTSINYGKQAIELAQKTKNKNILAEAINNTGGGYYFLGDYENAANYFYQSLRLREQLKDTVGISQIYNNIGNLFSVQNNHSQAFKLYNQSLELSVSVKDTFNTSRTLNNIGFTFQQLDSLDLSLKYFFQSLELKEAINHQIGIANTFNYIGNTYLKKKDYKQANSYFNQALTLSEQIDRAQSKTIALRGLAETHLQTGEAITALTYGKKALEVATKTQAKDEIRLTAEVLSKIYTQLGNFEQAHHFLSVFTAYSDTIRNEQAEHRITEMQVKYDIQKKETENIQLKAERDLQAKELAYRNISQYLTATLLISVVVIAIIFFKGRKHLQKVNAMLLQKNKEITQSSLVLEEQKEALAAQAEALNNQKDELERINNLKDKLFSVVAHDLRGPFVSLKSIVQLMLSGALPENKKVHFLRIVEADQQNALWLLENLLTWAKAQMKGMEVLPVVVDIHKLTEENMKLLRAQADQKKVTLENSVAPFTYAVADKEMIKLVFRNLISNAIKFCKAGDNVTIAASEHKSDVTIAVKDTGIGMSPEQLNQLFSDKNFTSRGTANEKGSGLGLQLCKDFVELNGGMIWVESTPGYGSEFKFTLPCTKAAASSLEQEQPLSWQNKAALVS
ncbi:tetratricopeptide repeat-containing sensor histidine kinase [Pontibacter harenae]|uniref:tetratricopeptide repeat-containing sensor histidine kinase n=1 Tax=Pontibacter harenae TaxID=2894083 RepID=UPI001E2ED744|nr:tetratricopeptide repeat-containing sensor histidine kinase [Pontibacter harenae]MCC9166919.1 tetratricopeptide repeat-containing sensor histidine kinase [Pontibacter harenae]